jgi:heme-degrading monooxygenase HmoA
VIIRVFRPTIRSGKESEFEEFLQHTAIPLVSGQAGLVAQHVGRPRDSTEYLYVTVWDSVESVRAFAGERWQEAVITPDEEHMLEATSIAHYDVIPTPL